MALFHKFFNSRNKCSNYKNGDICERLFDFSHEQVRILLFKECDYRGRKLLFDSQSIEKIKIAKKENIQNEGPFAEINNSYGFKLHKPSSDTALLSEMIFGTVSMSHRGTSLKIHCLTSPCRMMYTQIFPTPKHFSLGHKSTSNTCSSGVSSQSLDCSINYNSSSPCSSNSVSENSVHSAYSDTVLVCRRSSETTPLDVPKSSTFNGKNLSPGWGADSGLGSGFRCFHQSFSNDGSVSFCSIDRGNNDVTFSCGSLYKRYLRRTSTSLEYSGHSLNTSVSAEEYYPKNHSGVNNKLGVAIIIELTKGEERKMECFLLEHAVLMESIIWSARQMTEMAYIRNQSFYSIMNQLTNKIKNWLVRFLSGPYLSSNMWLDLSSSICDDVHSIPKELKNCNYKICDSRQENSNNNFNCNCECDNLKCSTVLKNSRTFEFSILNWTDFFKYDYSTNFTKHSSSSEITQTAKKFLNDFCELLETIDIKDTKFFMSTVITAILTHHLGWVSTVLPASSHERESLKNIQGSSNALWGQLTDLYGAVGHPTKISHTVISGTNKNELVEKIINCLSYFVRCSDIERKNVSRKDIKLDNEIANQICKEKSFIPQGNKKYKDYIEDLEKINEEHFKKMESTKDIHAKGDKFLMKLKNNVESSFKSNAIITSNFKSKASKRSDEFFNKKSTSDLIENTYIDLQSEKHSNLIDKIKNLGIEAVNVSNDIKNDTVSNEKHLLTSAEAAEGFQKIFGKNVQPVLHVTPCENKLNEVSSKSDYDPQKFSSTFITPKSSQHVNEIKIQKHNTFSSLDSKKSQLSPILNRSSSLKRTKSKAAFDLSGLNCENTFQKTSSNDPEKEVVFVLGDNEKLVGIKRELSGTDLNNITIENKPGHKTNIEQKKSSSNNCFLDVSMENEFINNSPFKEKDFVRVKGSYLSSSSSCASITEKYLHKNGIFSNSKNKDVGRCQSVPPEDKKIETENERKKPKSQYKYSGVKFSFQQHPQIVKNYLRSKNLEMTHFPFGKDVTTLMDDYKFDFTCNDSDNEEIETLQTPSNASDVVSFSELSNTPKESYIKQKSKITTDNISISLKNTNLESSKIEENIPKNSSNFSTFMKSKSGDTLELKTEEITNIPNVKNSSCLSSSSLLEFEQADVNREICIEKTLISTFELIELPMPNSLVLPQLEKSVNFTSSLIRGVGENYISNMVLQGTTAPKTEWESSLKQDLILSTRHHLLDQQVDEAVAIVANIDTWDVQLLSSHTYIVDKGSVGVRVGMSQLVSNMLESLLHLWKMQVPPENCLTYIEQKLQEFCILSKALAELLLATEFCSMELLTSTLHLEVNDVPLLMAVASTHSPQVTEKYGLSFQ